jgi:hypothetical protein
MQRNFKHEKQKSFLSLLAESDRLWALRREYPSIELEQPYQQGWLITIGLRGDIMRSKLGEVYEKLLPIAFTETYPTRDVKLIRKIRNGMCWTANYYNYAQGYTPKLKQIKPKDFEKVPKELQKYFLKTHDFEHIQGTRQYILNLPRYYFVLKVKPNIITHQVQIDGSIETQYQQIENKIKHLQLYRKFYSRGRDRWNKTLLRGSKQNTTTKNNAIKEGIEEYLTRYDFDDDNDNDCQYFDDRFFDDNDYFPESTQDFDDDDFCNYPSDYPWLEFD